MNTLMNGKTSFVIAHRLSTIKNADKIGGGTTALNDSRITKVGAFLRKTKLDEIPQLFNVLNGTMSIVGPRPELLRYTEQYEGAEKDILKVRPGITDYSSIEFINFCIEKYKISLNKYVREVEKAAEATRKLAEATGKSSIIRALGGENYLGGGDSGKSLLDDLDVDVLLFSFGFSSVGISKFSVDFFSSFIKHSILRLS